MKKLYSTEQGYHYIYKGHIICLENARGGERKYSYRKVGDGYDQAGHARTLSLTMLWVNMRDEK